MKTASGVDVTPAAPPCWVGLDVAKTSVVVAVRPSGAQWAGATDTSGLAALVDWLRPQQPTLLVLEATGGYEAPLVAALALAALPVVVVNPRQVRAFARALGRLAKTDTLDAAVLAHFAEAVHPVPRVLPDAATVELQALVERRRQLIALRTAETQRLQQSQVPAVQQRIQRHLDWLHDDLVALDEELRQRIEASPLWRTQEDLLTSVPGIGPTTACVLPVSCSPTCPNWATSPSASSPPWSESRRSTATAGTACMGLGPSGVDALRYAPASTCRPWSPCAIIPSCVRSTSGCWRQASPRKWPWWPACTSC